jgi:hypothetical protein
VEDTKKALAWVEEFGCVVVRFFPFLCFMSSRSLKQQNQTRRGRNPCVSLSYIRRSLDFRHIQMQKS